MHAKPCSSSLTKGDNPLCFFIEKDHGLSPLASKGEPCYVDDIQLPVNKTILACFYFHVIFIQLPVSCNSFVCNIDTGHTGQYDRQKEFVIDKKICPFMAC